MVFTGLIVTTYLGSPHLVTARDGDRVLQAVRDHVHSATEERPYALDLREAKSLTAPFLQALLLPLYRLPGFTPGRLVVETAGADDAALVETAREHARLCAADPEAWARAMARTTREEPA